MILSAHLVLPGALHHEVAGVEVLVDNEIDIKVIVIITERVYQDLGHLQPAEIENWSEVTKVLRAAGIKPNKYGCVQELRSTFWHLKSFKILN